MTHQRLQQLQSGLATLRFIGEKVTARNIPTTPGDEFTSDEHDERGSRQNFGSVDVPREVWRKVGQPLIDGWDEAVGHQAAPMIEEDPTCRAHRS
jgi:hypothetical protein